jgi:hypothetical protein
MLFAATRLRIATVGAGIGLVLAAHVSAVPTAATEVSKPDASSDSSAFGDAQQAPAAPTGLHLFSGIDTTPPSVSITGPSAGSTISGTVVVTATAADNFGVAGVQFKVDGANLGAEDTTLPYSINWNTSTATNGAHTLTAVAREAPANHTSSTVLIITIANDTTPLVRSAETASAITASGATIDWTTNETSDSQVDYGLSAGYGSSSALNASLVTAHAMGLGGLVTATQYHYRVRSKDAAGNLAVSGDFTFATLDAIPPTVSISAPAAGATVSGTVNVSANAGDNVAVVGVQFQVDGANLGLEVMVAPYVVGWATTTATNGSHALTAVARDAAANKTVSAAVTVTASNSSSGAGIAALYPGDVGIEGDARVVFVEKFDEASLTTMQGRWTDILNPTGMVFSADVPPGSPVAHSLDIPSVGGGVNTGGHLYKLLTPGVNDTLYVRYYIKYPAPAYYTHTGIWMGGRTR